jgi:hypothetical protein
MGATRVMMSVTCPSDQRCEPGKLTDEIWAFLTGAVRLPVSNVERAASTRPRDVRQPLAKYRQR